MELEKICWVVLFSMAIAVLANRDRNNKKYKVVCYSNSSAHYRTGEGKFRMNYIDPFLCTHLIFAFANLSSNHIVALDPYRDLRENNGLGAYERFNNFKKQNPNLTTLIAIGGRIDESKKFEEAKKYSEMAGNPDARATFAKSVVDFCLKYNFDGLDIKWLYPNYKRKYPQDKQNFVTLLKELKETFEPHGLLLTAGVVTRKRAMDAAYDIPGMAKYLDFINVEAFDLHGPWENVTGLNSPLYGRDGEKDESIYYNVDYAINYWIERGAPRSKVILGMAMLGRSFILRDTSKTGIGAPAIGRGTHGPLINIKGVLGYNEICSLWKEGWQEVFDLQSKSPYAFKGDQWVGYDNKRSIGIKVDYLIKENLGGGMIWALDMDDFRGRCFGEKYPLLTTIANKLNGQGVESKERNRRNADKSSKSCQCKRVDFYIYWEEIGLGNYNLNPPWINIGACIGEPVVIRDRIVRNKSRSYELVMQMRKKVLMPKSYDEKKSTGRTFLIQFKQQVENSDSVTHYHEFLPGSTLRSELINITNKKGDSTISLFSNIAIDSCSCI